MQPRIDLEQACLTNALEEYFYAIESWIDEEVPCMVIRVINRQTCASIGRTNLPMKRVNSMGPFARQFAEAMKLLQRYQERSAQN